MKIYKLYRHGNASPELINSNEEFMFILTIMDNIVKTQPTELIYIVEYDTDLDRDDGILLYHGNYERYLEKKKLLLEQMEINNAIQHRRELIHSISEDYTRKLGKRTK